MEYQRSSYKDNPESMLLNFTNNLGIIITSTARRLKIMPNIKPVSDLRNYNEVLKDIAEGEPVFLTKNGRGKYAIIIIEDYEKMKAEFRLINELSEGEQSGKKNGWLTMEEVKEKLDKKNG